MKRLRGLFMGSALLLAVLLTVSGLGSAQATWRIGIADPPEYFMTKLTEQWAEDVTAQTGGAVRFQVFPSAQLGGDLEMLESLQMGTLPVWEGGALVLAAFDPINDIWALPYVFEGNEHRYRFWDEYLEEVSDLIADKTGFRIVAVLNGPNRQLTVTRRVEKLEDLRGLKIRVPEVEPFVKLWRALGTGAVAMPFTEVHTAMQTRVVDGQENDVLLSASSGFFDIAKYLVLTEHVAYDGFIVLNESQYRRLSPEVREAMWAAGRNVMLASREQSEALEAAAIQEAVEKQGVTVISPDLAPFREVARQVIAEYPHVEPILKLIESAR